MGIEAEYDYTPRVYRRIVFAATQSVSFAEASESLDELAELPLLPKRVWRAAKRIGEERVAECGRAAIEYEQLTLPAQRQSPIASTPQVACVQMDGGRYQQRQRVPSLVGKSTTCSDEPNPLVGDSSGEHWREYKAGLLMSMTSEEYSEDPCPTLPATFADPGKMRECAREIKGFTSESHVSLKAEDDAWDDFNRPKLCVKSVVATSGEPGIGLAVRTN